MSTYQPEILQVEQHDKAQLRDLSNQDARTEVARLLGSLAQQVLTPGQPIREQQKGDNRMLLLAGSYGGCQLKLNDTLIQAMPGASITGNISADSGRITIQGVRITGQVLVGNNAVVQFIDCTFAPSLIQTGDLIAVAAGGKVSCLGCWFLPGDKVTNRVDNAGAGTAVQLVGCVNLLGKPDVNATITGDLT